MADSKGVGSKREAKRVPVATKKNSTVLIVAALDMSWRLAIVVLVPIIGGYQLDRHFGIEPALTLLGFLLSMVGVFIILKQTVANADNKFKPKEPNGR